MSEEQTPRIDILVCLNLHVAEDCFAHPLHVLQGDNYVLAEQDPLLGTDIEQSAIMLPTLTVCENQTFSVRQRSPTGVPAVLPIDTYP